MNTAICFALSAVVLTFTSCVLCAERRGPLPQPCESEIYCYGEILHDIQMARIYNDSKTFVDMKLSYPENEIVANYRTLRRGLGRTPTNEELIQFINENFEDGDELEEWTPPDFKENPAFADMVCTPKYATWVKQINDICRDLSRKVKSDVRDNPELYSLLFLPNGFLIAGGRFRELYYWDSYWIIRALLILEMPGTARGIIENFIYLFKAYGKVPNGSRKYYQERSQPPLLTKMVDQYYQDTNDLDFVRENIQVLEDEFNYWMTKQSVLVTKGGCRHRMARYYAPSSGPRPESYREDYTTAENIIDDEDKQTLYTELKSGAESGWDFSSRWVIRDGTNNGNLSDTKITKIIPVDLNAFLHCAAETIRKFYSLLGNGEKARNFNIRAEKLKTAIHSVLWSEEQGIWFDYDLENRKPREYFSASNFAPLWTDSYVQSKEIISRRVLAYIKKTQADSFIGGFPTTLVDSGLQWDLPNGWPPLQEIVVEGLSKLGTPEAENEARCLAEKWLETNYAGYQKYGVMFEKYNVTTVGETGGGGEYNAQTGFGWTNGVVLDFLSTYDTTC